MRKQHLGYIMLSPELSQGWSGSIKGCLNHTRTSLAKLHEASRHGLQPVNLTWSFLVSLQGLGYTAQGNLGCAER